MKNSLERLNNRFEQRKERTREFKHKSNEITLSEERKEKKDEEQGKETESKRIVGHHQAYQQTHNEYFRRGGGKKNTWKIFNILRNNGWNFPS